MWYKGNKRVGLDSRIEKLKPFLNCASPTAPSQRVMEIREQHGLGRQQAWVQVPDLPLTGSVTLKVWTSWAVVSFYEKSEFNSNHTGSLWGKFNKHWLPPPRPQPSSSLFFCSDTLSWSVHHFFLSKSSCRLTDVSLPKTWFYLEKNGIRHTRVYNNFEIL